MAAHRWAKKGAHTSKTHRKSDWATARIHALLLFFSVFLVVIVGRLFHLQIIEHPFYKALASDQQVLRQKLFPDRGAIFASDHKSGGDLYPLATNQELHQVYAVPRQIENVEDAVQKLLPELNIEEDLLRTRLSKKDDLYEPLQRQVSDAKKERIEALGIKGIRSFAEDSRYYPLKELGSHITGFLGNKGDVKTGQYGLEEYFEKDLAGEQGYMVSEKDTQGRWIGIGTRSLQEAKDGDSLALTIDYTLQYTACTKLREAVQRHGADRGTVIIMDPSDGSILALCNAPDYDPNDYGKIEDMRQFNNSAVMDEYEPGSVFKPLAMAAALDTGKVGPNTTYTDTGKVTVGSYTIKNSDLKANGVQTMTQVLEKSLNTGAIFAVQQAGNQVFYEYVKRFGFGEKTGITFPAEAAGNINSLASGKDVYAYTGSYGQGLTTTPLQLVTAYAALINGGKLMKPFIMKEVIKPNGSRVRTEPQVVRQVISEKTSMTLAAMMVNVITKGHGERAGVKGYFIAGKTGTAQVPKPGGGYSDGQHNDTFLGFGPINSDFKFVMLAKIDNPRDVQWAEGSAAPLFGEIAQFLLDYYQVPPDRNMDDK